MTLSVCMIVKNEQEMLPRCLDSIAGLWDQLVIVDTGSTDKTVEIAESYGAEVYHHEWENDFSLHRNQSIGYATGDWVFIIDADEELVTKPTNFKKRLGKIREDVGALGVLVTEKNGGTNWVGVRFFRRENFHGYKNIVHNKAVYDGSCAGTDLVLLHYGYSLSVDRLIAKQERTEKLLRDRLEENPEDYIAMFYLLQICVVQNRNDEAIEYGRKCFELYAKDYQGDMQYLFNIYYMMAVSYMKMRDGNKAYAWATKGLSFHPDDLDLNYVMARMGYESMNDEMMKTYGEKYLEQYDCLSADQMVSDKFENPFDGGKFAKNITVYTHREDTRKQVSDWLKS